MVLSTLISCLFLQIPKSGFYNFQINYNTELCGALSLCGPTTVRVRSAVVEVTNIFLKYQIFSQEERTDGAHDQPQHRLGLHAGRGLRVGGVPGGRQQERQDRPLPRRLLRKWRHRHHVLWLLRGVVILQQRHIRVKKGK